MRKSAQNFGRKSSSNAPTAHQERINEQMFHAIEILGHKLERTKSERNRLSSRLLDIESSAEKDKKTGKYYLPVALSNGRGGVTAYEEPKPPKWMMAATALSTVMAVISISAVLSRTPTLTDEQISTLNALPQFAQLTLDDSAWRDFAHKKTNDSMDKIRNAEIAQNKTNKAIESLLTDITPEENVKRSDNATEETTIDMASIAESYDENISPASGEIETVIATEEIASIEPEIQEKLPVQVENTIPETYKEEMVEQVVEITKPVQKAITAERHIEEPKRVTAQKIAKDKSLPAEIRDLEQNAIDGVAEAQHDLATLYASGDIMAPNFERAAYWFRQAAERGVANAHYNLGVMYHQGLGVRIDLEDALAWYHNAAELGHPEALYNLGIAYVEGIGTDVNVTRATSFFKRAAHAGIAQAGYNLGILYESSFIGGEDSETALRWYRHAAGYNHADAVAAVERLTGMRHEDTNISAALVSSIAPAAGNSNNKAQEENFNLTIKIQRELINQGLLPGLANGVLNDQTRDAIRDYQRSTGLLVDGKISHDVLDFLLSTGAEE